MIRSESEFSASIAATSHHVQQWQQRNDLVADIVSVLVSTIEARDPYTCGHSERVASFAACLAEKTGMNEKSCERVYLAGLLHDIGKIAIPDQVLQKSGRLTDAERLIIQTHAEAGWRILHQIKVLQSLLPGVLHHHERWDGQGYPDRLAGEAIPVDARVLAVCDAFDAMTSNRTYRQGMSTERAIEVLRAGAGQFWDPDLVCVFEDHLMEIDALRMGHRPRQPAERFTRFDSHGDTVPPATQRPLERPASPQAPNLRHGSLTGLADLACHAKQDR